MSAWDPPRIAETPEQFRALCKEFAGLAVDRDPEPGDWAGFAGKTVLFRPRSPEREAYEEATKCLRGLGLPTVPLNRTDDGYIDPYMTFGWVCFRAGLAYKPPVTP